MYFFPWQVNKTSIIIDASKYIEELKQKVERLNEDIGVAQSSTDQNPLPMVQHSDLLKLSSINYLFSISFLSYPLAGTLYYFLLYL